MVAKDHNARFSAKQVEHFVFLNEEHIHKTGLNKKRAHDFGRRKNGQRVMMDG